MSDKTKRRAELLVNVAWAAAVVLLCWLALKAVDLVLPFVLALALVALLSPFVRFLHRRLHMNRRAASVAIMALLYIGVGFLIFALATQLILLLQNLFTQLPGYYRSVIQPALQRMGAGIEGWLGRLSPALTQGLETLQAGLSAGISEQVSALSGRGVSFISRLISGIPGFLITLVFTVLLSFFISIQYEKVTGFIKKHLPRHLANSAADLKKLLKGTVFKYIKATLILMLCTFAELTVGFLILGVANPVGKAAGIAIFDALPVFGTGGIMIPWVIVELLQQNFRLAGGLAVVYAVVTVVRNLIEPKVVGDQLGLNPIVSLLAIYLGYKLVGVAGMILFPILAQVVITLYRDGTIWLFKRAPAAEEKEAAEEDAGP